VRQAWQEFYAWVRPWRRFRRRVARRTHLPPALARVAAIDGLLTEPEAQLLYDLARAASGGCIVEIGTFHGKSTVALALGAQAGSKAKVYGVDPLVTYVGAFGRTITAAEKIVLFQNLLVAGVAEHVWLLQTTSARAACGFAEPVALLWVDGDHSYEGVKGDLESWAPHVVPGGILAFHDSLSPRLGVGRFLEELLAADHGYERVALVDKTTVLRKRDQPGQNGSG
jgi:predicted O-methyltransferase YrrM